MKLIATLGLLILTNIQIIFAQTANDWYKKGDIASLWTKLIILEAWQNKALANLT